MGRIGEVCYIILILFSSWWTNGTLVGKIGELVLRIFITCIQSCDLHPAFLPIQTKK
jgi:hypothetical protein